MVFYTLFTMAGANGPRRDKMLRNSKLVRAIKLDLVRLVIGKNCAMSGSWQQFAAVLLDLGTEKKVTKKNEKCWDHHFLTFYTTRMYFFEKYIQKLTTISWAYFVEKFLQGFGFRANFDDVFPVTSTCDVNVTSQWRHTKHIRIFLQSLSSF